MRVLMKVSLPIEPFNTAVRNGTAGQIIQRIVADAKPEAVYFTELEGRRAGIMVVDVADPSRIPVLAEPWFLSFNAEVSFHIAMTPEDLGRSGLDIIGKNWPAAV